MILKVGFLWLQEPFQTSSLPSAMKLKKDLLVRACAYNDAGMKEQKMT